MNLFIREKLVEEILPKHEVQKCYPLDLPVSIIDIIEMYRRDVLDKEKQEFYSIGLSKTFLKKPKYVQAVYFDWNSFVRELNYVATLLEELSVSWEEGDSEKKDDAKKILKYCSRLAQFCPYNTYYVSKSCGYYKEIKKIREIIYRLSMMGFVSREISWKLQRNYMKKKFNFPDGEIWLVWEDFNRFCKCYQNIINPPTIKSKSICVVM